MFALLIFSKKRNIRTSCECLLIHKLEVKEIIAMHKSILLQIIAVCKYRNRLNAHAQPVISGGGWEELKIWPVY